MLLTRWARRHLRIVLWSLTLPLFAIACYAAAHDAEAAFYLSPFRAWELLLGVLAAAAALPSLQRPWLRNLAAALGLLVILFAGVFYSESTHFPGPGALAPCLGATLILLAGEHGNSFIGQTLAWKPVRFIGLISYSLYLWHWPIQVFQATENILVPDRFPAWTAKLAVFLASLLAATLSWRYVEQPFRTGVFRGSRTWLFSITGALFAIIFAFTFGVIRGNGWGIPHMPLPPTRAVEDLTKAIPSVEQVPWDSCLFQPESFPFLYKQPGKCLTDDPQRPTVLLLGDSHAGALYWGFKNIFPQRNISLLGVTRCTPTLIARNPECQRYSDAIFKDYLPAHQVDTVILVSRWIDWDVDAHMADTVAWLRQHRIKTILIGPFIEFDAPLVRLMELSEREHDPALPGRHRDPDAKLLDDRMRSLARDQWHVPYISLFDDLCQPQVVHGSPNALGCPLYAAPGIPLLYDTDHLSPAGALLFAHIIDQRHQLP